jgi:hypothetical protein
VEIGDVKIGNYNIVEKIQAFLKPQLYFLFFCNICNTTKEKHKKALKTFHVA